MNLWREFRGRIRRYERVDFCLSRGGWWSYWELHRATGLGSGTIYTRLAALEESGRVLRETTFDGRMQWSSYEA